MERWLADEQFRDEAIGALAAVDSRSRYGVRAADVRYLWDRAFRETVDAIPGALETLGPILAEYLRFREAKLAYAEEVRASSAPTDQRWRAWRERQMARLRFEVHENVDRAIVHPLFACELSDGCSVGCWFCGVSAPKLKLHFLHTPENAALWRAVVAAFGRCAGPAAARWGFLYWATDPFDNPDYERFCLDFYELLGTFPHTTTAQPHKDLERTRRFLRLSEQCGCHHNRFSILSLPILDRVHDAFTADELALVELVLQNKTSVLPKQLAGRARKEAAPGAGDAEPLLAGSTIACVSGFLLNLCTRSVKLISPCASSRRWPLGYRVYAEATFTDADDLERTIERFIEFCMPLEPDRDAVLAFHPDLTFEPFDDGFALSSPRQRSVFRGSAHLREWGDLVRERRWTPAQLGAYFSERYGVRGGESAAWAQRVFDAGATDEFHEPVAPEAELAAVPS
ncbi:MAG: radical SAM family RiPP maturation amino acid epimerase [Candidatus Eremiobacteraeota bacterium]|nr:radical SAM family RiPP maturation amino acid epimerase [Candidatus Eremiobacteraeota bacterium]